MQTPLYLHAYQLMHELINSVHTDHTISHDDFCITPKDLDLVIRAYEKLDSFKPITGIENCPNIAVSATDPTTFGILTWLRGDQPVMLELRKLDNEWIVSFGDQRGVATIVDREPSFKSASEWLAGDVRRRIAA